MNKKKTLCLVLACGTLLTAAGCQPKTEGTKIESTSAEQNLFGDVVSDFDSGTYNPASEEGIGEWESLTADNSWQTAAPTVRSDYAGATPVLIDPIDKPTATPLPTLTFSYTTYTAGNLQLSFEGPNGWLIDDSASDAFVLTNPDPSMDYAATLSISKKAVDNNLSKADLVKQVKAMLTEIKGYGFKSFSPSSTAERSFLDSTGVYANYKATLTDGTLIAGRIIMACVDKQLYTLHVSYPQGYTSTYVDQVYDKFRHSVQLSNASGS